MLAACKTLAQQCSEIEQQTRKSGDSVSPKSLVVSRTRLSRANKAKMTTALETIPADEEGATLLHKPKTIGIRRVVVGAALSGACNKACPSGKDSECLRFGGDNSCAKCDTTSGTRFMLSLIHI